MEIKSREERLQLLREMKEFEDEINGKIDEILEKLNWNRETVLKSYEKQEKANKKAKREDFVQYSKNYQEFYQGRIPSLTIDKELQAKIIEDSKKVNPGMTLAIPVENLKSRKLPGNSDDVLFNFTREEKLSLYEYAAEKLKNPPEDEKSYLLKMPEESTGKSMTFADVVDMERQLKRRRMKYRTTKEPPLSHNEIMRKLISTQTEAWQNYLIQNERDTARKYKREEKTQVTPKSQLKYSEPGEL